MKNNKDVIHNMTTEVNGLLKIGKCGVQQFDERMRFLEVNGYHNIAGLKRFFVIELENYSVKESLLHEVFNKHMFGNSEWNKFTSVGQVKNVNNSQKDRIVNGARSWLLDRDYPNRYWMATHSKWEIEKLYCSQLVWRAYADEGFDIGSRGTNYVSPSSIFYDNSTSFMFYWAN